MKMELSWPEPALWPNERAHWKPVSRARRGQRHEARMATLEQMAGRAYVWDGGTVRLTITGHKPRENGQDRTNFEAALKAALDGVADAIAVNDKYFVVATDWGDNWPPRGGVTVEIDT